MSTPLPPPTVGSGALFDPRSLSASASASASSHHHRRGGRHHHHHQPRASPVAHFSSSPNDGIGNDSIIRSLLLKNNGGNSSNGGAATTLPFEGSVPTSGRLLAANASYVAYAVKKGLVRVIDRRSAAKGLLRGHGGDTRIVDAAFFGGGAEREGVVGLRDELAALRGGGGGTGGPAAGGAKAAKILPPPAASDVLATVGGMTSTASVIVWRIRPSSDGNPAEIGADRLLEVRYPPACRIAWHPFNPNRFLLLCRNLPPGEEVDDGEDDGGEGGAGGRTVAVLVETTRLVTRPHPTDGHMVCDSSATATRDSEKGGHGGDVPGMIPLRVLDDDDVDLTLAGANDLSWSSGDARHVLTGHDDGFVRLWDLDAAAGRAGGGGGGGGGDNGGGMGVGEGLGRTTASVPCVAKLDVAMATAASTSTTSARRVTRVLFLPGYEDGVVGGDGALTPPFITGTDMNHTVTLWAAFPPSGGRPARLRVFGLRDGTSSFVTKPSSLISLELVPAPYRPPIGSDAAATVVPSSFLMMAERGGTVPGGAGSGGALVHALHLDAVWKTEEENGDEGGLSSSIVVKGFDYVSTLSVAHPVYSLCVAPSPPGGEGGTGMGGNGGSPYPLEEERDVDLCCVQSKAVQVLTISAEMCAPPEEEAAAAYDATTELAPGVTLLDLLDDDAGDDDKYVGGGELAEEEEEEGEEFEGDEYDMEEEDGGVEYSTQEDDDDDDDDDDEPEVAVPTAAGGDPDAFSNWLGAIASPPPPSTSASTTSASAKSATSPPPGLGFASSILPPPPGMGASAAAPAAPTVAATIAPPPGGNRGMAFLSPMQILGGSASVRGDPDAELRPEPAAMAPPPGLMPAAAAPVAGGAAKKAAKKKDRAAARRKTPPPSSSSSSSSGAPGAGPMKILTREEPKDGRVGAATGAVSSALPPRPAPSDVAPASDDSNGADLLGGVEAAVRDAVSARMKSHQQELLASVREAVAEEVSARVGSAVRSSVKDSFKQEQAYKERASKKSAVVDGKAVEAAVQRGVAGGLAGGLGVGLEKVVEVGLKRGLAAALSDDGALSSALEKQAKESAERAAREAVAGMQPSIVNSLQQTMRESMIPAYEAATRQMFQQTSASLEKGLSQMASNQQQANDSNKNATTASLAPTLQAMSAQMVQMSEAIRSLSAEVVQLRGAVKDAASGGGQASDAEQRGGAGGPPQPLGMRDEIIALCRAHRYEEAFTKAVTASDGDVVLFACKNADSSAVFNGEGVVSQPILICLMQQLGAVLVSASDPGDMKEILNWLQEIALTIDPTHVNIQRHIGGVVQQLLANINNKMSNCDPTFRRPLQTLMQVIRGGLL